MFTTKPTFPRVTLVCPIPTRKLPLLSGCSGVRVQQVFLYVGAERVSVEHKCTSLGKTNSTTYTDLDLYFQPSGEQHTKDRKLGFNPCSISYLNGGSYIAIGGSNRQATLCTKARTASSHSPRCPSVRLKKGVSLVLRL